MTQSGIGFLFWNAQKVVHGKYKETIDVAVKMVKPNCMTEKEFISEAKVMAYVPSGSQEFTLSLKHKDVGY